MKSRLGSAAAATVLAFPTVLLTCCHRAQAFASIWPSIIKRARPGPHHGGTCLALGTTTKLNAAAATGTTTASPYLSADRIYFDIAVEGGGPEIGRLVFRLTIPSALPAYAQRLIDLCQSRHYVGSSFDYGADYVETEARYRWCHVLRGRPVAKTITDHENQRNSKHNIFGGTYYGDAVTLDDDDGNDDDPGGGRRKLVVLAVAVDGPGHGTARFSIVRVGESPPEWGTRLLLNAGVIGELVDGMDVLTTMARQKMGPPKVTGCGVLPSQ